MSEPWPTLPLNAWQDTYDTLHLWTQIAGKIRMKLAPKMNHWWHATLYVNARGLTTSPIPYGGDIFEIQFDFLDHRFPRVVLEAHLELGEEADHVEAAKVVESRAGVTIE